MITALRTGLDAKAVAALHEPIVEALRRQDPDAAGKEIRRHVEEFGRMVLEGRSSEPSSAQGPSGRPGPSGSGPGRPA
jgi:DNA-binding FadR family transcriptional regulator